MTVNNMLHNVPAIPGREKTEVTLQIRQRKRRDFMM